MTDKRKSTRKYTHLLAMCLSLLVTSQKCGCESHGQKLKLESVSGSGIGWVSVQLFQERSGLHNTATPMHENQLQRNLVKMAKIPALNN